MSADNSAGNGLHEDVAGFPASPKPLLIMSKTATDILNELIITIQDGQEGFRTAAEDVSWATARDLLAECSLQRVKYTSELEALAKSLGEPNPEHSTSLAGKLHRGWMNLKSVLTKGNDHAVLAECERGEDTALTHFKEALAQELPPQVRSVVQSQFEGIQAAHDKVRDLRDRLAEKN